MELRRFKMLNKNDSEAFFAWRDKHNLGREELMIILCSVSLDHFFNDTDVVRKCANSTQPS